MLGCFLLLTTMNLNSYLRQVAEFHSAFQYRQPEPKLPDLSDSPTNKLRPELIREELIELHDALKANDRVGQLDALCDLQYVLSGAVLAWGFRSMISGTAPSFDLRKIHDIDAHIAGMLGMVRQLETAAQLLYAHQVFTLLRELQSRLCKMVFHLGFTMCFDEAFNAVHENNLAKIWTEGDREEWTANDAQNKVTLHFDQSPRGWIARRSDNKIIKPNRHSKVDLSMFV